MVGSELPEGVEIVRSFRVGSALTPFPTVSPDSKSGSKPKWTPRYFGFMLRVMRACRVAGEKEDGGIVPQSFGAVFEISEAVRSECGISVDICNKLRVGESAIDGRE